MKNLTVERTKGSERNQLGEGPFWCRRDQSLYWVDILLAKVWKWSFQCDDLMHWDMPKKVSAVFTTDTQKLAVVLHDELALFDPESHSLETVCPLDTERPGNRSNDAKVSPDGSLWAGTMDDNEVQKSGRLWRIDTSGQRSCLLDRIGIANTLAWNTERGVFYFADSTEGRIYRFPYPEFEDTRNTEDAYVSLPGLGVPDGSALDTEGCLWNVHWDGAKVVQYSPEGKIKTVIDLPVGRPTSCCFMIEKLAGILRANDWGTILVNTVNESDASYAEA